MNEVSQTEQPQAEAPVLNEADRQALQQKLSAGQEAVATQTESDIHALGAIGSRPVVTALGEVMTPQDRAEELRVRQDNGHAYQR